MVAKLVRLTQRSIWRATHRAMAMAAAARDTTVLILQE